MLKEFQIPGSKI